MSNQTDKLKKYITEVLNQNVEAAKAVYEKAQDEHLEAITNINLDWSKNELLFNRAKVAELKYGEALMYKRQWENQKHQLT